MNTEKAYFEYRFIGKSQIEKSKVYNLKVAMEKQREFIKKNKNKLEFCEIKMFE